MVDPRTPYLRVDLTRLRHNIRRIAAQADARGLTLRPHAKTHKCVEVARLQMDAGAVGLTVATIGEAETFVNAGIDDVFIAFPLWLDDLSAPRLGDLLAAATITIGIDSVEGAANAGRLLGAHGARARVEVDSGHHRSGVAPDEAGALADAAKRAGLDVRGVFTFPGHSYDPDATVSAAQDEAEALATAAASLLAVGVEPQVVSGGSTPSLGATDQGVLNEVRPGVYVFGDAQQWELGTCSPDDLALTCRSSVVSHAGGRLVLDSGSKVLGADRAPYATGSGRLLDHPEARVVQLSEHHAVVDLAGVPLPPLGARVDVVPNHVCAAVNLADTLWADGGGPLLPWPVAARGRNG